MKLIKDVTEKARESMFIRSKQKLVEKFSKLKDETTKSKEVRNTNLVKEPVLNLASDEIPSNQMELLKLGPKFVPNEKCIPYMDIISTTESSALKLEYSKKIVEAQNLRKDILKVIKTAKPVKDNLNRKQRTALRELKNDENISIYPFDKVSGLVRIRKQDAIDKIREQIGNTNIITDDPTKKFATDIRKLLSTLNKKGKFTKKEYECLYPSDPIPPRMYGTIKAHKPEKNYPMRIVVSTIGTPSYGISQHLVTLIQPTLNNNDTRLCNSATFVRKSREWNISPEEVQVSYDVINLYPSVPLGEATNVILDLLNSDPDLRSRTKLTLQEIRSLILICISKCYFLWNDEIHELRNSGPIGLSLMVVLAEGFLQVLEAKAMEDALYHQPPIEILSFQRYVDDSHARFKDNNSAVMFQSILNNQHKDIQYTIDFEKDKTLEFLDIRIINNGTGKYDFDIYRKEAITNVQVRPESSHDPKILQGIFKGFIHRALTICSTKYVQSELEFLIQIFVENGFKEKELKKIIREVKSKLKQSESNRNNNTENDSNEIKQTITLPWIPTISPKLKKAYRKAGFKVVFKSPKNIQTILTSKNKSKLPKNSFPGVYEIPCSCGKTPYRGETKMKISTRSTQHKENVRKEKWDNSAIALHSKQCDGTVLFEETKTVKVIHNRFDRKVRESLEIQMNRCHQRDGGMNLDDGQYVNTKFWLPFFTFMRKRHENVNLS